MTMQLDYDAPLGARRCAFCRKGLGCFAYVRSVLEALGGEPGNGYAHTECLRKAKRGSILAVRTGQRLGQLETLRAAAPVIPVETCPAIDSLSTLADAISGDVELILEQVKASRCRSLTGEGGIVDELHDALANLATVRLRLEDLRQANDLLRQSGVYWYEATKRLLADKSAS